METRTLVLNSRGMPHEIVCWEDAISLLYAEKVDVIAEYDEIVSSPSISYFIPAVLQIRNAFSPVRKGVKYSRMNIFSRDGFKCFGVGTRILMADGSQKPIEDVQVGDRVIDAFGFPQRVVDVGCRIEDHPVRIKHRGSYEWTLTTRDHPFLQPSGEFVPIGDNPEYLVFPRIVQYELMNKPYLVSDSLPRDKWFRFKDGRIFLTRRGHESGLQPVLTPSADLSYFLGLYCAEGSSTVQGLVALSFNLGERHTLAKDACDLLQKLFGLTATVDEYPSRNTCVVRVGSILLATLLVNLCGKGSSNKKVPWALIGTYSADFLRGLFLGDGHIVRDKGKVCLSLTAHACVVGAQSLLWGLGIFPTFQKILRDGRKPSWQLILQAGNFTSFCSKILGESVEEEGAQIFGNENFIFRRLQQVRNVELSAVVYNLETTGSHSYIANGLSVHNCQYCGERKVMRELNLDHVLPRKQGGTTNWWNIVTSCYPCNERKAGRTPEQAGMPLLRKPAKPHSLPLQAIFIEAGKAHPAWAPYLDRVRTISNGKGYYILGCAA